MLFYEYMILEEENSALMMINFEAQRLRVGEVSRDSESHLRAVIPATKGIDAFVLRTRREVILIVPSLKEYVCTEITRTISKLGTRATYNF